MEGNEVIARLRSQINDLLVSIEQQTGLMVRFGSIPHDREVVAEYKFNIPDKPTVSLRRDWQDVDVAHELMHMRIELIEGYAVLAWKPNIQKSDPIEKAFGLVRSYVDDEVVHAGLLSEGYQLDGEILKPNLFEHLYNKATKKMNNLRLHADDSMAHFDDIGYGELRRSAFLVQAELIAKSHLEELSYGHKNRIKRFIKSFRLFRKSEAEKADMVLAFFNDSDVQSVEGHRMILSKWAETEGLDQYVGLSSYRRQGDGYTLPFP